MPRFYLQLTCIRIQKMLIKTSFVVREYTEVYPQSIATCDTTSTDQITFLLFSLLRRSPKHGSLVQIKANRAIPMMHCFSQMTGVNLHIASTWRKMKVTKCVVGRPGYLLRFVVHDWVCVTHSGRPKFWKKKSSLSYHLSIFNLYYYFFFFNAECASIWYASENIECRLLKFI